MSRDLIEPNLHVALLHFPIALLVVGTLIELFAPIFWRRSTFRAAGRWMILIGALSLVPVAASGLYAMADLNGRGQDMDSSWADIRASSPIQGTAWEAMKHHAIFNALGAAILLFLVVIWLAGSDRFRSSLHIVFLLLLLVSVAIILRAASHGGDMVYDHGIGVQAVPDDSPKLVKHDAKALMESIQPLEIHVILAGAAIALGLAAIGVALRGAGSVSRPYLQQQHQPYADIGYAINPASRQPPVYGGAAQLHPMDDPGAPLPSPAPVSRFWVLAALLAIGALLAGAWTLASGSGKADPKALWEMVKQNAESQQYRQIVHVAVGGAIIVLMLLLALIGRAGGRRIVIAFFSLLLLLCVAAQGWIGTELLLDTSTGKLQRYQPATGATTVPSTNPSKMPLTTKPSTLAGKSID